MSAGGTSRVETRDGASLAVHLAGRGEPLVLVSGLGGTAGFWEPCRKALAARHLVVTFDQRGIGDSTRGASELSIQRLAADVLAIADALGFSRFHLVGHSTGGAIGQAVAWADAERLQSLTLSATWLKPSRYMDALFRHRRDVLGRDPRGYARMAALLAHPPDWLEANWEVVERAEAAAPVMPEAQEIVRERIDMLLDFDGGDQASAIGCPTLILGARDDMIVPWFLQKELHAAIPHARPERLPDGGHFYPVTRTSGFCDALLWFLESGA